MEKSFTEILSVEIAKLLLPLLLLDTKEEIQEFLTGLGWEVDLSAIDQQSVNDIKNIVNKVEDLLTEIKKLPDASDQDAKIQILKDIGVQAGVVAGEVNGQINTLKTLVQSASSGTSTELLKKLPRRLGDYLVYTYLHDHYKKVFAAKHLLGLVEEVEDDADKAIKTVQWNRISKLFTKPIELFDQVYDWSHDFDEEKFLKRFEKLILGWGLAGGIYEQTATIRTHLGNPSGTKEVRMPLFQDGVWPDDWRELDINISPYDGGKALLIYPYFFGGVSLSDDLNQNWSFELEGATDIGSGFGLGILPPAELELKNDLVGTMNTTNLKLGLVVKRKVNGDTMYLFGSPGATHLSLAGLTIKVFIDKEDTSRKDFGVDLQLQQLRFELKRGEGDGFINKILPENGLESEFDLQVGYSLKKGFYFKGSGTLGIDIPQHLTLGPLHIIGFRLGFKPNDLGLGLDLGATFKLKLGPITGLVENIGLTNMLTFPEGDSSEFSLTDFKTGFKPPDGIALSLETKGFSGGGYLYISENRYAGALQLRFNKINLTAIAILDTQLPNEEEGYALLIMIKADGFKPIQLGMGFTLNGVGGLLALNRSMDLDLLRAGVKNGRTEQVLFPAIPTLDGESEDSGSGLNTIISGLDEAFPITNDQFVFGPMFKLAWGSGTNVFTADVGLLIEIDNPLRIAIVGLLKASIGQNEEKSPLVIKVAFQGTFEPANKKIAFDASIFASRLMKFTLQGDMACRLIYGERPNFLLTVGGFHPSYQPPPLKLSGLKRITVSILNKEDAKIFLETYFAVTSNTIQVGAKVEAAFAIKKYEVVGILDFDALFQFEPFRFYIEASGKFVIYNEEEAKFKVDVAINLAGPAPWDVSAKATIEVLGVKFKLEFQKTFGERDTSSLPNVDVEELFLAEIDKQGNWSAVPPSRIHDLVKIQELRPEDGLVVDPFGSLEFSQKVLPLKTTIQKFGNKKPLSIKRFQITKILIGQDDFTEFEDAEAYFAPAQFRELTDSQKLSSSSFILYPSGVRMPESKSVKLGNRVTKDVNYEGDSLGATNAGNRLMNSLSRNSAIGRSELSRAKRIKKLVTNRKIKVHEEGFRIVHTDDLSPYDEEVYSEAMASEALFQIVENNPALEEELQIVPEYEVDSLQRISTPAYGFKNVTGKQRNRGIAAL